MTHFPERATLSLRQAEIELADVFVAGELRGGLVHHDAPVLEDVAVRGDRECHHRVLLDQKHGRALPIHFHDDVSDALHHERRQPERRLVEQQKSRVGHERSADREHLLLPA